METKIYFGNPEKDTVVKLVNGEWIAEPYNSEIHKNVLSHEQYESVLGIKYDDVNLAELRSLDLFLPRWAEDLIDQGGYKVFGEASQVYERKKNLRRMIGS